jgi:hypothetical protein
MAVELPKYRATRRMALRGEHYRPGDEFETRLDDAPGWHWVPFNEAARRFCSSQTYRVDAKGMMCNGTI